MTSDAVQIWTAMFALIGTMFSGFMAYLMAKLNQKQEVTANKTDEVKEALEVNAITTDNRMTAVDRTLKDDRHTTSKRFDGLAKVALATHSLVKTNLTAQLHLNMMTTRRLADITHDPKDIEAAELAEALYKEHESKQFVSD